MNELELATGWLRVEEGLRLKPYKDTVGKLTIGYGRNLDDVGISPEEAEAMLEADVRKAAEAACYKCVGSAVWMELTPVRKAVLIDMCFNLGVEGLKKFTQMLNAIVYKQYERAGDEMLNSKWALQVGSRAIKLAERMRNG